MGNLSVNYKKAIFDELANNISSNESKYYAFASNPILYANGIPAIQTNDLDSTFTFDWQMIFGKKISATDIAPIITNIPYTTNTVYSRYDNTDINLLNENYYVVTPPGTVGGDYTVYKCIDNANGTPSLYQPNNVQVSTFSTLDGYLWKYIYSISSSNYSKFSSAQYVPVYPNTTIQAAAANNSGVEVVVISNSGVGYATYDDGLVGSVNSTAIQIISNTSSGINNFYTNNAIYVYSNVNPTASQLFLITNYVSNTSGNFVYVNTAPNTALITAGYNYKISPAVVFNSDGSSPAGYSVINAVSNSIANVVIINKGSNISWANASIQSNSIFGSGATLYPIVPPAGGHGSSPATELDMNGFMISFTFANNESNNIITNVTYNKIGLIKNPYTLNANGSKGSTAVTSNTFNQLLKANVFMSSAFTVGTTVVGSTSKSLGTVAFANTSTVYLTGDKYFVNNEIITSTSNSLLFSTININTSGDIYSKDLLPLYIQNITNVTRSNTQSESFKLIIQI